MTTNEALDAIIPGKTYPAEVIIHETYKDKPVVMKFCLQSYVVGMYCCVYMDGQVITQTGDNSNKTCVAKLKKDIRLALDRGAKVEIGSIRNVKTSHVNKKEKEEKT